MHTNQCTRIDLLNVKYFNFRPKKRGQGSKEDFLFFYVKGSKICGFNLVCVNVCVRVSLYGILEMF